MAWERRNEVERQRLPLAANGWDFQTERLLDGIGLQSG
jgi:hypothetical protein